MRAGQFDPAAGALQLASTAGSEASTVMSARRCPLFLATIGCAVEMANRHLRQMYPNQRDDWIQIRRFHVLRDDFSIANGMLVSLTSWRRPLPHGAPVQMLLNPWCERAQS